MHPSELARYIDHTILKADATPQDIEKLCTEANQYNFAAVCVNSCYVPLAKRLVQHGVAVASVVGFPLGAMSTGAKCHETRDAIANGATEIDMVINIGWLKSGLNEQVREDIRQVVNAAGNIPVKVIIEAAMLSDDEKVRVCQFSKEVGAAFVKTSTGFGPGGATVHDVSLMRATVGEGVGVKASGGVRGLETALSMISAGANRIGTSSGIVIVEESKQRYGTN